MQMPEADLSKNWSDAKAGKTRDRIKTLEIFKTFPVECVPKF